MLMTLMMLMMMMMAMMTAAVTATVTATATATATTTTTTTTMTTSETTTTTGECSVYDSLFSTCVYNWLPVLVAASFAPCKSANMEQAYSHANMQTWKKLTARWNRRCQNENLDMRSFSPICKQQDVIATDQVSRRFVEISYRCICNQCTTFSHIVCLAGRCFALNSAVSRRRLARPHSNK